MNGMNASSTWRSSRADDCTVLGAERLRQREQEAFFVAVIFVAGVGECTCRRHHGKEAGHAVSPREPSLEVGNISLQLCLPGIDKGRGHDRAANATRDCKNASIVLGVEFGKGSRSRPLITAIIGSFASASVNGCHSMPLSRRCT